ncbi:Hypothetical_protein [Hexamita inflata]|uniref:Hypothetical_protein n=1 Tax=Hexamita inflata TaxID=28002 RepID=A0AA86PJ91_9EUKA|nr:Hypothetical protein HINF_LOCUS25868 [Hexamita inflata]
MLVCQTQWPFKELSENECSRLNLKLRSRLSRTCEQTDSKKLEQLLKNCCFGLKCVLRFGLVNLKQQQYQTLIYHSFRHNGFIIIVRCDYLQFSLIQFMNSYVYGYKGTALQLN